jgi:hypothetical protein
VLQAESIRFLQIGYHQFYLLSAFKPISLPADTVFAHKHVFFIPKRTRFFFRVPGLFGP